MAATDKILTPPKRTRINWSHWDARRMRHVMTHPTVYTVTEPDGYERCFDTKLEAEDFIRSYNADCG